MSDNQLLYDSFGKIVALARELNTQISTPEIVFIGPKGHGKSRIVDAFLGHGLLAAEPTKRVIRLEIINKSDCKEPRITVKKSSPSEKDVTGSSSRVQSSISKRNDSASTPLVIQYETSKMWNLTLIDTPGFQKDSESDIEAILAEASHTDRTIVVVEDASHTDNLESDRIIKRVDPKLNRTIYVFNKFNLHLKSFPSHRELNRYFGNATLDKHAFFASTSEELADAQQLLALEAKDVQMLEQLQYDKKYESAIGLVNWKKSILDLTWKKHQENIPEVLRRLRVFKKNSQDTLQRVQQQLKGLNPRQLRATASGYVMDFLQSIEKLIDGTLEGNPAQNGETLEEQDDRSNATAWQDAEHRAIKPAAKIPYADSKLYGGQQFERLLAEFKIVAESQTLKDIAIDEVATTLGANKLNNVADYAWMASDLTYRATNKLLRPLVDQLFERAEYIMKRLVVISDHMLESRRKKIAKRGTGFSALSSSDASTLENMSEYPFFTNTVKDLYYAFIEKTAASCRTRALDEFFDSKLIYWEATTFNITAADLKKKGGSDQVRETVEKLAYKLFEELKNRIIKNIMLKTYNYFLVPMQTSLWGEVQAEVTCFSDSKLEELFELNVTVNRFQDEEKQVSHILAHFEEQEQELMDAANRFSHPLSH